MKTFLCSYVYNGQKWSFEIHADSFDAARDKLRWLKMSAVLDGEAMLSIPVPMGGWVEKIISWWRGR